MGVARGEATIGPRPFGGLLDRHLQFRRRFIKTAQEEVGDANHPEVIAAPGARIKAQRSFDMRDRQVGLSGPDAKRSAQVQARAELGLRANARSTSSIW